MRKTLSLFFLMPALTLITASGCGNTDFTAEEGKTMAEIINPMTDNTMTEGYQTATFALG